MNEVDVKPGAEYIRELLFDGEVTIEFTKKDGTKRKMLCTLMPEKLPKVEVKEGEEPKKKRKVNEEVISVYDLEKKGWRSFRVDSVTAFSFSI